MRGHTTKLCPPRRCSRSSASRTVTGSKGRRNVRIGRRRTGGVSKGLRSTSPTKARWKVRGIGVAVRLRTGSRWRAPEALPSERRRSAAPLDHNKPKLLESDSPGGKRIGANDNEKAALRQRLLHGPGLGGLHEAWQL